jgi:hypothetical protein
MSSSARILRWLLLLFRHHHRRNVVCVFFIFFIFTSPPKTADRERSFLRAKMKRNPLLVFQEKEKKQVKNHQSRARIFISQRFRSN